MFTHGKLSRCEFKINCTNKRQLIEDIHYVTNHLFPIHPSRYTLSIIKGGNTNLLYLMTPNDNDNNNNKHKKLLIRVYGGNTDILIDRKSEEILFYELGELGFGPKLYAIFGNGRIEQFYDNAQIDQLYEGKHYKEIAKTMAKMHCLHPPSLQNKRDPSLWINIDKWYDIASNVKFMDHRKAKEYRALNWRHISGEINIIKSYLPSPQNGNNINNIIQFIASNNKIFNKQCMNNDIAQIAYNFMYESVLCHNDLIPLNILYLPELDEIKFIDFEYGAYNYRAFDFANHFCEYPGVDDDKLDYTKFPLIDHIKIFIKTYIDYLCVHRTKFVNKDILLLYSCDDDKSQYDAFLNVCTEIVLTFCGIAHYFWGLWSIVMAGYADIVHFDFIKYAKVRFHDGYKHSMTLLPSCLQFVKRRNAASKL